MFFVRRNLTAASWLLVAALTTAGLSGCNLSWGGSGEQGAQAASVASTDLPSPVYDPNYAPALPDPPKLRGRLRAVPLGSFQHGTDLDTLAAEIVAYDEASQRLFVVNGEKRCIDILNIADPHNPQLLASVDVLDHGIANSVAAKNGMVATCIASPDRSQTGKVLFLSVDGDVLKTLEVGHEPDMLTFTPDGRSLLVANEGEAVDDYTVDPEGNLSVIDVTGGLESLSQSHVSTIDFRKFNDQRDTLDPSIRIFAKNATVAEDLEPEYIAVSPDSQTAWITCQENNCLAIVDLAKREVTQLVGLGFKDHSQDGNWIDVSDKDGSVSIRPWPLKALYEPDGIACFVADGRPYLVTANEGDARNKSRFSEEVRVGDLNLDPKAFPNAKALQKKDAMGRLRVTNATGDHNQDGLFEELYTYGGRSFSIWDAEGKLVFDSGDQFERFLAVQEGSHFNADHTTHYFDDRSDNKGPEPEGVVVGEVDGVTYAFVLLERMSSVMVYDVSDPKAPVLETYITTRDYSQPPAPGRGGDLGPEGATFISAEKSPTGKPLLAVAYEVSGTTRLFELSPEPSAQTEP